MFLYLTDSTVAEVLHEAEILPYPPRWGACGDSLIVGSYRNGDEHEHHVVAETIGSGLWYGPESNDEFRFGEEDLTLKSIWFRTLEENMDLGSVIEPWIKQEPLVGSLRLTSSEDLEGFSPGLTDFRWFDPQGQMFACIKKNALLEAESHTRLRIAADVDLMFADDQLCGWILSNPLKYATRGWESPHPLEHEDTMLITVAYEYFQLVTEPFIEQMEDEDPSVLHALQNLNQQLKDVDIMGYQRKVFSDRIENLIEDFYGEIAA
jgi:hypothetical protein